MTASAWDYTASDLIAALRSVGLEAGDVVFAQFCDETLGTPQGCATPAQRHELLYGALREVLGASGTLVVPTYTFSFCRQQVFDVQQSPAVAGPWNTDAAVNEYIRALPDAVRSRDPIFSVAAVGPRAEELLANLPNTCLGADSIQDRIRRAGGKVCLFGVGLYEATLQHHIEEIAQVPWRFKKLFTGTIRDDGVLRKAGKIYNVRILAENADPYGHRLEARARAAGVCQVARLGRGEIVAVQSQAYVDLALREIARDPWLTARGPAGDPVALERARVGARQHEVTLPEHATLAELIAALWWLPRDIVSDGYDAALRALATQLPMTIHEYPTGTECWSWIVPEQWTCHEAYLETLDGRRIFSYADNPLHVVSYSLPFAGEVWRDTLFEHLHVHPRLANAIVFQFKYYERDWGLCCSQTLKDTLTDERYRVVIKSDFSYGTLKVGEVVARGASDETIVLCAHLCHPAMVNDDLSGVLVGLEVMRELLQRRDLRYTYRFLIVPETIGSVAYLSQNEALIPKMKGGLFLEMLGREHPHGLQHSFAGTTEIDHCFAEALRAHDPQGWTGPFRTLIGNDERQFNAPGARVPILSLTRILPRSAPEYPYREYHSSHDTPERTSVACLEDSRDLVLRMIDTLEHNCVPVNTYKGELFCSRFGIHIDWYANPEGHRALFDMLFLIDGTRTVAEIAQACGISFDAARQTIVELEQHGVVTYAPFRPSPPAPLPFGERGVPAATE